MNRLLYIDFDILTSGYIHLNSYMRKYHDDLIDTFDYITFNEHFLYSWRQAMETTGKAMWLGSVATIPFFSMLKYGDTTNVEHDMLLLGDDNVENKVDIINDNVDIINDNLQSVIPNYNVFLLRFYETTEPLLLHVCNMIRSMVPDAVIILGDKNNFMAQMFVDELPIDSLVAGFGEEPMADILERCSAGESIPKSYVGSIPKRDYFPEHEQLYGDGVVLIRTSYACLYNCAFCSNFTRTIKRSQRVIDIPRTVREIKTLKDKYGVKSLRLCDSLFYTEREELELFYNELVKHDLLDVTFPDTNLRTANTLEFPELYSRLNATFRIGFEHLDNDMLRMIGKGCTGEDNMEVIKHFSKAGKLLKGNFIYGLPGESTEVFDNLVKKLRVLDMFENFQVNINRFRLRTGSPMFTNPEKYGIEMVYNNQINRYFGIDGDPVLIGYNDDTLSYKDDYMIETELGTSAQNFPVITAGLDRMYSSDNTIKFYKG